jgi:O-antigen ligase
VGLVYGIAQARVTVPQKVQRRLSRATRAATAVAVVVGLAWGLASLERIDAWASERWDDFTSYGGQQLESSSNFGSIGSSRYDSWRVAVQEFVDAPLHGGGARSFRAAYLRHGETPDTPERSHSLELDVLGETGLVGLALLFAALVPPLLVLVRRARQSHVDASLLGAAAAWLAHASVDWIWTMPVLSLPFFALLAAGSSPDERRPLSARTGTAAAAVVVIVAVGIFMPPWVSSRLTDQSLARGRSGAEALEWARRLDPLAVEPLLAEANLARSPVEAIPPLRAAVRKEPESAALHYFLAVELARSGRRAEALAELEEARRLYPRGTEIRDALRRLRSGGVEVDNNP